MKTGRFYFFLLALLFFTNIVPACPDKRSEAQRVYQAGLQALAQREHRDAFNAFQHAVKLDTSFPEAHYQLGMLYGQQSQWKLAVRTFQTAINISPDFADAHCRLGEAYLIGLARTKEAISSLKCALQTQPNFQRAQRLLGTAYLRQHRIDDAIHHLKQAVSHANSPDIEARYLLGLAYFQSGDFIQAIPHFEAVLKRKKLHAKAHFNLGNCYLRTGRIQEGRTALLTYEKLSREEEQLETLRRFIQDDTQRLDIRHQFTELLIKREEWDAAISELKTCIAIAPRDEKAYERLGYIYLKIEAYSEARETYGSLVSIYPQRAVYRNSLGVAYVMLEEPRHAIVQFETAIRLGMDNLHQRLSLYRNLANAYRQIGEKSKAAQAYQYYRALKASGR